MNWTDERVDQLRRMHAGGMSGSEIAAVFGVTRNAVIGKIHRLGLSGREKTIAHVHTGRTGEVARKKTTKPQQTRKVLRTVQGNRYPGSIRLFETNEPVDLPGDNLDPSEIPIAQRKQLQQLGFLDCRWPYGEPGKADFFFCGGERFHSSAYCAAHARIAYAKASGRTLTDEERARRSAAARRRAKDNQRWGSAGA